MHMMVEDQGQHTSSQRAARACRRSKLATDGEGVDERSSPIGEQHGLVQSCHAGSGERGGEDGGDGEREHLVLA